jgi:hypothetical protein
MVWVTVDIHFIPLPNDLQFGTRRKQLGYLHRIRHVVASRENESPRMIAGSGSFHLSRRS